MKYYLNTETNKVYAFEEDGSQDHLIGDSYTAVTEQEAQALTDNEPVPVTEVTMKQARLALLQTGRLNTVNQAMEAQSQEAQIEWQYASTVKRDNQLTQAMVLALNLSESDLDDLFTLAATL